MTRSGTPRAPILAALAVVAAGAACVAALAADAPDAPGARRLAAPDTLLAIFDALAIVLLVVPGGRAVADTIVLAAVALPFHAAIAASAGAGGGHATAVALIAAAWTAASAVAHRRDARRAALLVGLSVLALPLAAYGLADFARLRVAGTFLASPLTAPVLLARRAADATAADAVPAIVACGVVLAATFIPGRAAAQERSQ